MRYSAFYLIEPHPTSTGRWVEHCDNDLVEFLAEPQVIEQAEGGRTVWAEADHILVVKLLFLAGLRKYSPFDQEESVVRIFGSAMIDVALFDRWWTARRLTVDEHAADLHPLLASLRSKVVPTGNALVDGWVAQVKDA